MFLTQLSYIKQSFNFNHICFLSVHFNMTVGKLKITHADLMIMKTTRTIPRLGMQKQHVAF